MIKAWFKRFAGYLSVAINSFGPILFSALHSIKLNETSNGNEMEKEKSTKN